MNAIFLAKGTAMMGMTTRDAQGNVTHRPPQFKTGEHGGCIAIGELDMETGKIMEPIESIYGDYDAAGYLSKVLEMLKPDRPINIPDIKGIVLALERDNVDFCDYCEDAGYKCRDCILSQWRDEDGS